MRFRNKETGHILSVTNKTCVEIMKSSDAYEVLPDESPVAKKPADESKTARSKAK